MNLVMRFMVTVTIVWLVHSQAIDHQKIEGKKELFYVYFYISIDSNSMACFIDFAIQLYIKLYSVKDFELMDVLSCKNYVLCSENEKI